MARNLHLAAGCGDPPLLVVESGAMETLGVLGETPRCKSSPIRVRAMSYGGLETNVYAFRNGQYSIRINDQWRVVFRWTDVGPEDVEIIDYH